MAKVKQTLLITLLLFSVMLSPIFCGLVANSEIQPYRSIDRSNENKALTHAPHASASTKKIAWVHDSMMTLQDELDYLYRLDDVTYAYDEYDTGNVESLWKNIDRYKVILIDEDTIYHCGGYKIDVLYDSFYNHKTQLAQWVESGGGLFITDNNDLYTRYGAPTELVWDWLPDDLVVASEDVGVDASGGNLQIFWDPGLFSKPNDLTDAYINDASRGHCHAYFTHYPGYSVLMIRNDTEYYGKPVEVFRQYGHGIVVVSVAELEAGFSWKYVQNEINYIIRPVDALLHSLDFLYNTTRDTLQTLTWYFADIITTYLEIEDPVEWLETLDLVIYYVTAGSFLLGTPVNIQNMISNGVACGVVGWGYGKEFAKGPLEEYTRKWIEYIKSQSEWVKDPVAYHDEIKKYLYERVLSDLPLENGDVGLNDVLTDIETEYNGLKSDISDMGTLPADFNIQQAIFLLSQLAFDIERSTSEQVAPETTITKNAYSLGLLQGAHSAIKQIHQAKETYHTYHAITTAASAAYLLVGVLLAPVTAGGSLIAAVTYFAIGLGISTAEFTLHNTELYTEYAGLKVMLEAEASYVASSGDILSIKSAFHDAIVWLTGQLETPFVATGILRAEIMDITVSDIIIQEGTPEDLDGIAFRVGHVTIKNTGQMNVRVKVTVTAYAPPLGSATDLITLFTYTLPDKPVTLEPGEQTELSFNYFGYSSTSIPGSCGFPYTLEAYLTLNEFYSAPVRTRQYSVCRQDDLDKFGSRSWTLMEAETTQGEAISKIFTTSSDTRSIYLTMFYSGSDLDLHLYDAQGRHVGLNYHTGEVETEIPGVLCSGPVVTPEWIILPKDAGDQDYTAVVVGADVLRSEFFTLMLTEAPERPPILGLSPPSITLELATMREITVEIVILECGGHSDLKNVRLSVEGEAASWITLNKTRVESVAAGNGQLIYITIQVPILVMPGHHSAMIVVTASGVSNYVPVEIVVLISLPSYLLLASVLIAVSTAIVIGRERRAKARKVQVWVDRLQKLEKLYEKRPKDEVYYELKGEYEEKLK